MICPNCKGETNVIDSRAYAGSVRRRRECIRCEKRFTSFEILSIANRIHLENLVIVDKRELSDQIRTALESALNTGLFNALALAVELGSAEPQDADHG